MIALPDGFQPEDITSGRGTSFYVGSLADGAVYRADARTGEGDVIVPGTTGDVAVGTEVDRRNRLWVAGGSTGEARVYDARTGELLREYQLAAPDTGFVNDLVVIRTAAYFTDSVNPVLYVVPLLEGGRLGAARSLPLTGELVYRSGFNANGIEASPDGRTLLVVQSNTGNLYAVDAATGVAEQVDLGGASLTNGDGLLRQGRTLYVVRNRDNEVAVVDPHRPRLPGADDGRPDRLGALGRQRTVRDARDAGHRVHGRLRRPPLRPGLQPCPQRPGTRVSTRWRRSSSSSSAP